MIFKELCNSSVQLKDKKRVSTSVTCYCCSEKLKRLPENPHGKFCVCSVVCLQPMSLDMRKSMSTATVWVRDQLLIVPYVYTCDFKAMSYVSRIMKCKSANLRVL